MRSPAVIAFILVAAVLSSCQTAVTDVPSVAARLRQDLCGLHARSTGSSAIAPKVDAEAQAISTTAARAAAKISRQFRVVGPAWFHNCLVNTGLRERGLCWHYMEEMFLHLAPLDPMAFDLHCGVRDSGSLFFEHHCVVITARGDPFATGLVLDPWTRGGRLLVVPVASQGSRWAEDPDFRLYLLNRHLRQRSGGGP